MTRSLLAPALFGALLLAACPAQAQITFTCVADSTMDGNQGTLLRIVEDGFPPAETVFVFSEAGKLRIYALREDGSPWDVLPSPMYYVPTSSPTIGDSWETLPDELGRPMTATVAAVEAVTTGAGTFPSAYRVDVRRTADGPSGPVRDSRWVVDGVGLVKEVGYSAPGVIDWQDRLESYSVTGGGYFPLDVGNTWTFDPVDGAPLATSSFGALKASP